MWFLSLSVSLSLTVSVFFSFQVSLFVRLLPPFSLCFFSIYRHIGACMGERGVLVGRSAGAAAKVLLSVSVARRVVGQRLRFRGSQGVERRAMAREERGGDKNPGFPLLCYACGGKKKRNSVVQNGTVWSLFFFLFFFKKRMKRRRFGENASFHSNVAPETRQRSHQSPNYFCSFRLRPCQFRSRPPSWPPFPL